LKYVVVVRRKIVAMVRRRRRIRTNNTSYLLYFEYQLRFWTEKLPYCWNSGRLQAAM